MKFKIMVSNNNNNLAVARVVTIKPPIQQVTNKTNTKLEILNQIFSQYITEYSNKEQNGLKQ